MDAVSEMVVVDLKHLRIWDFVPAGEDGHKTLEKARRYKADQISSLENLRDGCTHRKARTEWEKLLTAIRNTDYRIVSFAEYKAHERDHNLSGSIRQTTEEQHRQAQECLPPMH